MLSRGGAGITTAPGVSFQGSIISADAWIPQKREPLWAMFKKDIYGTNYTPYENGAIIFASSYFGIVYCVNPDGTTRWIWRVSEWMPGVSDADMVFYSSPPVVDEDGTIYLCDDGLGYLWAITRDGKLKWAHKLDNCGTWAGAAIAPDGLIYTAGGNESYTCADNKIYGVNKQGVRVVEIVNPSETLMHHNILFLPNGMGVVGGMDPGEVLVFNRSGIITKFSIGYSVVSRPVFFRWNVGIVGRYLPFSALFITREYKVGMIGFDGTYWLYDEHSIPEGLFDFVPYDSTPCVLPLSPENAIISVGDNRSTGYRGTFLLYIWLPAAGTYYYELASYDDPSTSAQTSGMYESVAITKDFDISGKGVAVAKTYSTSSTDPSEGGLMIVKPTGITDPPSSDVIRISDYSFWAWSGWVAPTIAGKRIYACNNNASYLVCYDFDGNLIWAYSMLGTDSGSDTTPAVVPI